MTKQYGTPGPRAIYPDAAQSPNLNRCSVLAQLTFYRLIAMADDQGRIAGDTSALMVGAFARMLDRVTFQGVEDALTDLERNGLIVRYQAADEDLVQMIGWHVWQQQRRAYPSRWPAPSDCPAYGSGIWDDIVFGTPGTPANREDAAAAILEARNRSRAARKAAAINPYMRRLAASRGDLPQPAANGTETPRPAANARARAAVPCHAVPSRASARSGARKAPSDDDGTTTKTDPQAKTMDDVGRALGINVGGTR